MTNWNKVSDELPPSQVPSQVQLLVRKSKDSEAFIT